MTRSFSMLKAIILIATMCFIFVPQEVDASQLYYNGPSTDGGGSAIGHFIAADDFKLPSSSVITGALVKVGDGPDDQNRRWDGTIEWWILGDNGDAPGAVIASGTGQNILQSDPIVKSFGYRDFSVNFDFGQDIPINSGEKYWLALHFQSDYNSRMSVFWDHTASVRNSAAYSGGELVGGSPDFTGQFGGSSAFDKAFGLFGYPQNREGSTVYLNFQGDPKFPSLTEYRDTSGLGSFTGSAFRLTPEEKDYVINKIVELVREDFKDFNINIVIGRPPEPGEVQPPGGYYVWGIDDTAYTFFEEGQWSRLYGKVGGNPNNPPSNKWHPLYARTWSGSFALTPGTVSQSIPPLIPYIHCTNEERHPIDGWYCGHFEDHKTITTEHIAQALANSAAHEISHLFGALHDGQINPETGNPVNAKGTLLQSEIEGVEGTHNKTFGKDNYDILLDFLGAAPLYLILTSPTHSKGQTSCERVLTVKWETPSNVRGIGGYSYAIVDQDDPYYDVHRSPDDTIDLDASVTSFTTQPLEPGHIWEFNILAVNTEGLAGRIYSSFWVDINSCSVVITRPRNGDIFQVGEWVNVFWDPISYGGDDVSGGYDVDTIDLLKGPDFVKNLGSNQANILGSGFPVPDVVPGSDYNIRIILGRNSNGDMFPYLPERFVGFSGYFTIGDVVNTGNGPVSVETNSGKIENLVAVDPSSIPVAPPDGTDLYYGLFSFNVTGITPGSTATITLTFPNDLPAGTTYWKYQASHTPPWYSITPYAINGNNMTLTLTDGGVGDADNLANGVIQDPGGPLMISQPDLGAENYRWSAYHTPGYEFPSPTLFRSWNDVLFTNIGPGDARNVKATIACKPVNVKIVDGAVDLGNIPAGGNAWSTDFYELETDLNNPQDPNKGIVWTVEYDDSAGFHYTVQNVPQFRGGTINCP